MTNPAEYAWLLPDALPAGEAARFAEHLAARAQGGPIPLQLSIGIFPGDLNDYLEGLASMPDAERALAIAAVEFAVELHPDSVREAALSLARMVVRGTALRAEDMVPAVAPLIARHGSAPPQFRPVEPLARRRLDVIAQLRSGVPGATQSVDATQCTQTVIPSNTAEEIAADPDVWGQFRDLRPVGGGSFGVVYHAWDQQLHREVALKLLRPGNGPHSDISAVLREARMMARVKHPNIVPVYGVDSNDGRVGLWSEWIEGATLAALVKTKGPLDAREAACVVAELCRAVSALHSAGMLHRDIKAENAMRENSVSGKPGRVLLMDFGLSNDPGLARELAGTPRYMAPELLAGGKPSVASDIYALGRLLHFLVTGQLPAKGDAGLPGPLGAIVSRATALRPEARFASAEGFLQALTGFAESMPRPVNRTRRWIVGGAIAALPAVSLSLFVGYHRVGGQLPGSGGAYETYQQGHALLLRRDPPGNLQKALVLFQKTIQADPKFALAHSELADAYWEQFRLSREAALKDRAIESANRALELDQGLAPIYVTLGRIHNGTGQGSIAMQDFRRALDLDSRNADVYRELAQIYDAEGRRADAENAYQKAIDLNPGDWRNYNVWGTHLFDAGKLDDAAKEFGSALQAAPENLIALKNLGRVQIRRGKIADARQILLNKVIALAPSDPAVYRILGDLYVMEGEFDKAAEALGKAASLTPSDYLNWANLAVAHQFGSGGLALARPAYLKAIELGEEARKSNPADPGLLADLGSFHAAIGDREQSLRLLRQALALNPDDTDVIVRIGEGYEILGFREKALRLIDEALRRGYPVDLLKRSPELAKLLKDRRRPNPAGPKLK